MRERERQGDKRHRKGGDRDAVMGEGETQV